MEHYEEIMVTLSESIMKNCLKCPQTAKSQYICCFIRVTHAINNIYKLINFLN